MQIEPLTVGLLGSVLLLVLIILRVHIAVAMAVAGTIGCYLIAGPQATAKGILAIEPFSASTNFVLVAIPLFILMGNIAFHMGFSADLYDIAYKWLGRLPGGLAIATIFGCAAFSGICGSSVATAVTMGTIAIPEMRKRNYHPNFACGCVAAGGTLGILIPPSATFVVYGFLTGTSISQLFISGILPGIMYVIMYTIGIYVLIKWIKPDWAPQSVTEQMVPMSVKLRALARMLPTLFLFIFIIGGMGIGVFTANEAAGAGVFAMVLIGLGMRRLGWKGFNKALLDSGKSTAMVMFIVFCAMIFARFMTLSRIPAVTAEFGKGLGVMQIILYINVMYLILGCFMDVAAMHLLTIPVIWPLVSALGIDPLWFGVQLVITSETAMITPPVGMNVYVIAGVARDVPMTGIFKGIAPFLIVMLIGLAIIIAFPRISTFLPGLMQ